MSEDGNMAVRLVAGQGFGSAELIGYTRGLYRTIIVRRGTSESEELIQSLLVEVRR